MKRNWGKSVCVGVSILVVCSMLLAGQSAPGKVRVGTFDSRAIALAYARSAMFAAERAPVMKDLKDRYEKAKV